MGKFINLHYIWFKDYYGFHNPGFNFSSKCKFTYDPNGGEYGKITFEKKMKIILMIFLEITLM